MISDSIFVETPSQSVRIEASRGAVNVYLTAWALGSNADAGANGQTGTVQIPAEPAVSNDQNLYFLLNQSNGIDLIEAKGSIISC